MANSTPSYLGQANGTGATDALFLKIFSGEVITALQQKTVMADKVMMRTISGGKSVSFPRTGRATAGFHTPGEEVTGGAIKHNEVVITIDGFLVASAFVSEIDELMNAYDVRSIYANELGTALAKEYDVYAMKEVIKGANAAAIITGLPTGAKIKNTNFASATLATKTAALAQGIYDAARVLEENDVAGEKFCVLRPAEYFALVQNSAFLATETGISMYFEGSIPMLAGVKIFASNNVPSTDTSVSDTLHGVNATDTMGIVFGMDAVGVAKLKDLSVDMIDQKEKLGTLILAKLAFGVKYLRQEACIELSKSA